MENRLDVILRSCIAFDITDQRDLLRDNFNNLLMCSSLEMNTSAQKSLYSFVLRFFLDNHHNPEISTVQAHFSNKNEASVIDYTFILKTRKPVYQGDFIENLRLEIRSQKKTKASVLLKEAFDIVQTGRDIVNGRETSRLFGPEDAINYVLDNSHDILSPEMGASINGNAFDPKKLEDFKLNYEQIKANPDMNQGQFSGIKQWDTHIGGLRKKELWIHAAFVSHMKSSIALNWAYNQAIHYKYNVLYYSLEMPFEQLQRILVCMHSFNDKFEQDRLELGIQTNVNEPCSLSYKFLKKGELKPNEEVFLFNRVLADLEDPEQNYGKIIIETESYNQKKGTKISDIGRVAEIHHARDPLKMIIIDHLMLLRSSEKYASRTDSLNEIVRETKQLTMKFNRDEGIGILALYQTSRDGYRKAMKEEGIYDLTAFNYSNEVEKSADIITLSFLNDELREQSRLLLQNLKSRDESLLDPFKSRIYWECRRILTCTEDGEKDDNSLDAEDLDFESALPDA